MATWERKRVLIFGKTRPELSHAYHETVCTGGILEDTRRLIRLYPIPLRFLEDDKTFKKYQWIEAHITKSTRDSRRESYKIRLDTIEPKEIITTDGNWERRAEWVLAPGNVHCSVESFQEARERDGTSIGLIKPREYIDFHAEAFPQAEKDAFWRKYRAIQQQPDLPFEPDPEEEVRPLPPPDFRFKIKFRCNDSSCAHVHDFTVFDWEVDALYNTCRRRGDTPETARDKVIAKLRDDVCAHDKDTHFFLGNIALHPHIFTIVGLWYPKRSEVRQRSLFD
jgi:hypothetical protein